MVSDAAAAPAGPAVSHLLYLHGFRSGPQSTKARQMAAWVAEHRPEVTWFCPQLPASPAAAMSLLRMLTGGWAGDTSAVIGSSLGGYYATVLAETLACRAVVINPAVYPARDLANQIGESTGWHSGEAYFFRPEYIGELQQMSPRALAEPARYLGLFAKGDEVLDWREMVDRYAGARLTVIEDGDHALSDFERHIPAITRHFSW